MVWAADEDKIASNWVFIGFLSEIAGGLPFPVSLNRQKRKRIARPA